MSKEKQLEIKNRKVTIEDIKAGKFNFDSVEIYSRQIPYHVQQNILQYLLATPNKLNGVYYNNVMFANAYIVISTLVSTSNFFDLVSFNSSTEDITELYDLVSSGGWLDEMYTNLYQVKRRIVDSVDSYVNGLNIDRLLKPQEYVEGTDELEATLVELETYFDRMTKGIGEVTDDIEKAVESHNKSKG